MTLLLIALGVVVLTAARPVWKGYHDQYLDKITTQSVNGIFILLVFLSHFCTYVDTSGALHQPYMAIRKSLGQMVVTTFLFYSGYGVGISIRRKSGYAKTLLTKRIPQVWSQFAVAIALYALLNLAMGNHNALTPKNLLLCLIGWNSIGYDNWYIFTIILLYFFTYVAFTLPPPDQEKRWYRGILILSLICLLYCDVVRHYRPTRYYNTLFAYVIGVLFSCEKENIDRFLMQKHRYWIALAAVTIGFRAAHIYWYKSIIAYQLTDCLFALLIVLFTMKVQIKSNFLRYCGEHLFSLFILHRIPMIVLKETLQDSIFVYFSASAIITFALSWCFDSVIAALRKRRISARSPGI